MIARAIEPEYGKGDHVLMFFMLLAFAWDIIEFIFNLENSK